MALRILLADDEKEFVETLAERLSLRGHEPRVVYDGLAALQATAAETPDVVVLDLFMPGLPGDEVLRRIKAAPSGRADHFAYRACRCGRHRGGPCGPGFCLP